MTDVLHIVDEHTPTDMLDQLALLAGEGDTIVSAGPAPVYEGFTLPVRQVHCPLGIPQLAALRLRGLARRAKGLHAWSRAAAAAARFLPTPAGGGRLLSWPSLPEKRDLPFLAGLTNKVGFHLVVPTEVAQTALRWAGVERSAVSVLPPAAAPVAASDLDARRKRLREAMGLRDDQFLLVAPSALIVVVL